MSMSFKASPDGTYGEILVNGQVVAKLPVTGNAVIPGLVGTVSQSGGVPTGAVVERGSNANGEYVRFADGTQICVSRVLLSSTWTAIGSLFRTNSYDGVFPASFVGDPPSISAFELANVGLTLAGLGTGGAGVGTYSLVAQRYNNPGVAPYVSVTAIGRWF